MLGDLCTQPQIHENVHHLYRGLCLEKWGSVMQPNSFKLVLYEVIVRFKFNNMNIKDPSLSGKKSYPIRILHL